MHNMTRRFFIGGLTSALAIGPRRIFAVAPGAMAGGKPALSFGLLSDIHIALAAGGKSLHPTYTTEVLVKAFEWFRDNGADAVVIAGDMAHCGLGGELMAVADAWFKVFPGDKAPDGRHVERVFVFGNHDWSSPGRAKAVFPDEAERKANLIVADPKKWWREAFHEDWSPFQLRNVNGYDFVCAHWTNGGCRGKNEVFTKGLKAYYETLKGKLDTSKPFFHVQHPHPKGTVHGDGVWGQDDGTTPSILSAYQNAVAFSGHSHTSLTDERSIWQGAFTSVGCATLRDVSLNMPGVISMPDGMENTKTPKKHDDASKAMGVLARMDCKQGQLVRVYGDRIVFSRREFVTAAPLCDDLVMPLPAAERRPFEFAGRAAAAKPPKFPEGAALVVEKKKGALRGNRKAKVDVWELTIPAATAEKSARPAIYEVTVKGPKDFTKTLGMTSPGMRFPKTDPRNCAPEVFRVACSRLPAKGVTFSVSALSCWGRRSEPISATV